MALFQKVGLCPTMISGRDLLINGSFMNLSFNLHVISSRQHYSAAQLSNLQFGKTCRFEAVLGLAGANNNSSN